MTADRLSFRTVRPAHADGLVVHQDAFPVFFLSSLRTAMLRQFYQGFARDSTAISTATVAEDRETVGKSEPVGFSSRPMKRRLIHLGAIGARESGRRTHSIPLLLHATRYRDEAGTLVDGALLDWICVHSDPQGKDTGKAIIEQWALGAVNSGARPTHPTTDADGNGRVNRSYQSLGWEPESTYSIPRGQRMNRYPRTFTDQKENLA